MEREIEKIIEYFEDLNAIPRCSKNEGPIGRYLQQWASSKGFDFTVDSSGNMVVRLPAGPASASAPTVIIQGHMDMVCEKTPESPHDFNKDAIRLVRDGDWVRADGTTLGADNGIALAYAMALAEDNTMQRPPLELLFTVDEETGLNGVKEMPPDLVTGRILINLDSEEEGVFTIGCAGGMETHISKPLAMQPLPPASTLYRIVVGGLRGGHSGIDIHKHRGNAIQILARVLAEMHHVSPLRLVSLKGGTRHNAIARDAEAIIAIDAGAHEPLNQCVARMEQAILAELAKADAGLFIKAKSAGTPSVSKAAPPAETLHLIKLILALPHGVAGMSPALDGLVETSSNLAVVSMENDTVSMLCSQRSALISRLTEITHKVHAVADLAGASVRDGNHYAPWQPDMTAPLLAQAQKSYTALYGKPPAIQVIHAGLECAIIGDRCPGMQMISFGPNIENAHSPSERMHMPSVEKVWRFLKALLADIGKTRHGAEHSNAKS